ncbi:MAG: hypothetical protein H6713_35730 [Myxococcales bacterium]|nr:hypothetical protein [Myxococcales bacterium]
MRRALLGLALLLPAAASCDTGQVTTAAPLRLAGVAVEGAVEGKDGALITLTAAELAFGPLYLCAGTQAGELCETARLEWLESAVVDALDPTPTEVGELVGVTGVVRSWMYDLGLSSQLTQQGPLVLDAAEALGGSSVRLTGQAELAGVTIPFLAAVPIQQEAETEQGVPVVRKSASEDFEHELREERRSTLLVRFDPRPWVAEIDFADLLVEETCSEGGPAKVCAGVLERTCGPDGAVAEERDCAAEGAGCYRGLGCAARVEFAPGSQGFKAVRDQVVSGPRPAFEWSAEDRE